MKTINEQNVHSLGYEEFSAKDFFSNRGIIDLSFSVIKSYSDEELVPLIEVNGIMLSKGQIVNFHIWPSTHIVSSDFMNIKTGQSFEDCTIRIYYKIASGGEKMYSRPRWSSIKGITLSRESQLTEWEPVTLEQSEFKELYNSYWDYTENIPDHFDKNGYGLAPMWFNLRYSDVRITPQINKDGGVDMHVNYTNPKTNHKELTICHSPFCAVKEDLSILKQHVNKWSFQMRWKEYYSQEGMKTTDRNTIWFSEPHYNDDPKDGFNLHGAQLKLNSYSVQSRQHDWDVHFLASQYLASLGIGEVRFKVDVTDGPSSKDTRNRITILATGVLKESNCPISIRLTPAHEVTDAFLQELINRKDDIPDIILKQEYGYDLAEAGGLFYSCAPWPWVAISEIRGHIGTSITNPTASVANPIGQPALKDDYQRIRTYLQSNEVDCLYHFTERSNLESIRKNGGLFSWKYCEENGIRISRPGGSQFSRELDMRYGLADYVRVSFCSDHPMAYRLTQKGYNLVLLKIKIDVAWLKGTLYSDINATDSEHTHGGGLDDLKRINISATKQRYVSNSSPLFKQHQAELLVKTFIPIEYILNLDSPESLDNDNC